MPGIVLETERLLLRPWRVDEAVIQRELWLERDERVPAHRRIDTSGHPTVAALAEAIRARPPSTVGFLAAERKSDGEVLGHCGLIDGEHGPDEPELAYELLHRSWGRGYATKAACSVIDWARTSGHRRLWASVWDWNTASRRVLQKIGFTESSREAKAHGINLVTTRPL